MLSMVHHAQTHPGTRTSCSAGTSRSSVSASCTIMALLSEWRAMYMSSSAGAEEPRTASAAPVMQMHRLPLVKSCHAHLPHWQLV